ncbi:hypothetical protein [Nitrosopumilus sp.]|uniref:hypothetical protein n=1 Tax=Nitrosopumilus sp. TaxID=2024843 RepID=UPI0029318307|nr:hypothetical protein [Nitrosopumilus sp.]
MHPQSEFLFASVISILVMLPFVMMPLDDAYYESFEENYIDVDIPVDATDTILFVGISIITGIISNILFYFIGKKLGGNTSWKKVFSVLFLHLCSINSDDVSDVSIGVFDVEFPYCNRTLISHVA